jgi:hypothetical protein
VVNTGWPDPAQAETRHRDAELRRAEIGIQIADDVLRHFRPPPALGHQDVQLRFADADERELGGDKKSVQQHQRQHRQDFQRD